MTNGKNARCLVRAISTGIFLSILLFPALDWAGNKAQIEKRVEDLDNMNKEIVGGFSDIPQTGTIRYKAVVTEGNRGSTPRVRIMEKQIDTVPASASPIKQPKTAKQSNVFIKTQTQKTEME